MAARDIDFYAALRARPIGFYTIVSWINPAKRVWLEVMAERPQVRGLRKVVTRRGLPGPPQLAGLAEFPAGWFWPDGRFWLILIRVVT